MYIRKFPLRLNNRNDQRKTDYHVLARLVPRDLIPPEVTAKLDALVTVAQRARPRS